MGEPKKNKKMTIDGLAVMFAKGFASLDKKIDTDIGEVKKDIKDIQKDLSEVKENVKYIKRDILNLGDRFVSYHTFDALANRVKVLEEKKK
jgi:archaellum component FlaC